MARMTLREAAERTSRSITTLRRYIRSGRLVADKRDGRFGPEYFVSDEDLTRAGLPTLALALARTEEEPAGLAQTRGAGTARIDAIPLGLYQELQYKHEQLLVQYGMMRAGGLRAVELRAELEESRRRIEATEARAAAAENEVSLENGRLKKDLRQARLELEGRSLEIAALEEKVRALEMLTRNAVTNESIDKQFRGVLDQKKRVEELRSAPTRRPWLGTGRAKPRDH